MTNNHLIFFMTLVTPVGLRLMLSKFVELGESNHTGGVSSRNAVTDKSHQSHGSRADALNFWIRFGTCDVIDVCPNMIINKSRVISENKTLLRRISQRVIQLGIVTISASEEFRGNQTT